MHLNDTQYFVEKRAERGRYVHKEVDGRLLYERALKGSKRLEVGFNVGRVMERVKELLQVRVCHHWFHCLFDGRL